MEMWLNRADVRKALNVPVNSNFFSEDNGNGFTYMYVIYSIQYYVFRFLICFIYIDKYNNVHNQSLRQKQNTTDQRKRTCYRSISIIWPNTTSVHWSTTATLTQPSIHSSHKTFSLITLLITTWQWRKSGDRGHTQRMRRIRWVMCKNMLAIFVMLHIVAAVICNFFFFFYCKNDFQFHFFVCLFKKGATICSSWFVLCNQIFRWKHAFATKLKKLISTATHTCIYSSWLSNTIRLRWFLLRRSLSRAVVRSFDAFEFGDINIR